MEVKHYLMDDRRRTRNISRLTVRVERDDVPSAEDLDAERVVPEVDPDLHRPELGHGHAGLLGQPLPVVLRDELVGVQLGQSQHQVNLPELLTVNSLHVKTSAVAEEVVAEYLQSLVYRPYLVLKFLHRNKFYFKYIVTAKIPDAFDRFEEKKKYKYFV